LNVPTRFKAFQVLEFKVCHRITTFFIIFLSYFLYFRWFSTASLKEFLETETKFDFRKIFGFVELFKNFGFLNDFLLFNCEVFLIPYKSAALRTDIIP
jgi:hypothetical protein